MSFTVTERTTCRLCGTLDLKPVLDLGNVPLADFLDSRDQVAERAPLVFTRCEACGLLQLGHTVERDRLYRRYWYRSGMNDTMKHALAAVVADALDYHADPTSWLDIGANDGTLLSLVPDWIQRMACEPSLTFTEDLEARKLAVLPDYFSAAALNGQRFSIITSCAMFYDVDDPASFVNDIRESLEPDGVWVNQLSDAHLMLKRNAFDNIVHEHLCYYDAGTLARLYADHGLQLIMVSYNETNGGSIRTVARLDRGSGATEAPPIQVISRPQAEAFALRTLRWRRHMRDILANFANPWVYGASTKGVTLLSWLGVSLLTAVADKNPRKHGLWMPPVPLEIKSEEEMREARPDALLVLPWAFRDEFLEREATTRALGTAMLFPLPSIEIVL